MFLVAEYAMNKKTVGQRYVDKLSDPSIYGYIKVLDLAAAQQENVMDEIIWCIKHAQKKVDCSQRPCPKDCTTHITPVDNCYSLACADYCRQRSAYMDDTYITYEVKQEKLMPHLHRFRFTWTIDCPTPTYDQTIFKYIHSTGDLKYMWTIPDRETCKLLLANKDKVVPEERQLLDFVIDFANGTLFKIMKKENGEKQNSPELEKTKEHYVI